MKISPAHVQHKTYDTLHHMTCQMLNTMLGVANQPVSIITQS